MSEIVQSVGNFFSSSLGATTAVFLLAMLPIAEARLAILFGVSMGLKPYEAFGWAFLGSSLTAPILILTFMPIINALARTKLFSKIGKFFHDKFQKKSAAIETEDADDRELEDGAKQTDRHSLTKSDIKKIGGIALFVAVPLPLTGVWTGSAVSSILKMSFPKALFGVIIGNAAACGLVTLIGFLFGDYVDYITLAFFAIVIIVILAVIVKLVLYKPKNDNDNA